MLLIASYPRSGNHLVRFFVEYLTGRATLGCFDNPQDLPIFQEVSLPELAHVRDDDPIGHKAHYVREIRQLRARVNLDGMILIRRQPSEAILSHRQRNGMRPLRYLWKLAAHIWQYNYLTSLFRRWPGPKLLVRYEVLVSDRGADELSRIIEFLGDAADPERSRYALENFQVLRDAYGTAKRPNHQRAFKALGDPRYHRNRADPWAVRFVAAFTD